MAVPPTAQPRSLLLRILDGILILAGLFFAAHLLMLPWRSLRHLPGMFRVTTVGSLVVLAWGLFRLIQGRRSRGTGGFICHITLVLAPLTTLAGWPLLLIHEVRQARRAHDTTRLCALVRHLDEVGPLGLTLHPARTLALDSLRQQANQDRDARALADVVCSVLRAGGGDTELVELKHTAATHLLSLARTSDDPLLLSSLASEIRLHGWEDDPDCRPLLTVERERTVNGAF